MAVQYNPKHFLRQVPNALLYEFFQRKGQLAEAIWLEDGEMDIERIFEKWQGLDEPDRREVERIFRSISDLSTKDGIQTLLEEGRFHNVDLSLCLDKMEGLHQKAFWVYLNQSAVFRTASVLDRADHLNNRYWKARKDVPATKPDISHPTRDRLAQAISKYYHDEQGRGEHCSVEVFLRRDVIHYFFAYPADYADTVIVYNGAGGLERVIQKGAFEVIFAYNESSGSLDVFVEGRKELRQYMEQLFAKIILKVDIPELDPQRPPYDLTGLKSRDFVFATDPEDRIKGVRVKDLRLSIQGPGSGRILLMSEGRTRNSDIYALLEKAITADIANGSNTQIDQATFQVDFEQGEGKPKKVTFRISTPDSCNLKDKPEHLKIKEYLKRWGLAA